MRLAEIAKQLRITTQELRKELAKTNFGISPTAHEVEDPLAAGILRVLKGRVKPTLKRVRVATVIDKEGRVKEVSGEAKPPEKEVPESGHEAKGIQEQKRPTEVATPEKKLGEEVIRSRKEVPHDSPITQKDSNLAVSRRIEVAPAATGEPRETALPHTYYRAGKKHRHKKGAKGGEEKVLEVLRRHPHSGEQRKQQVARVRHIVEHGGEISSEELKVEQAMDRERFREQKRHRALGQKKGPKAQPQIKQKTGTVELPDVISLKEFAEKSGLPVPEVISHLLKNGIMATINQKIDYETAAIVADEMGVVVKKAQAEVTSEALFERDLAKLLKEDDPKLLKHRPPVITIMGHVDHGKTKLLDTIRQANVMATEAGGITQHIGAYQVEKNGHKITFLDTPGHEAFTAMRARGAKVTDIAILVVAADEGVQPQTIEAINHAREAKVPIIVALTKIDKANASVDRVKGELIEYNLQPEDWGGKTVMVPVSAQTGEGIDHLLEMILLVAEIENLRSNPNRPAVATVIESNLNPSLGPMATVLINTGTLKVGDSIVVGTIVGKIKAMHDHTGKSLQEIGPSGAVKISGLSKVPQAGDILQAFPSEKIAKKRAEGLILLEHEREKVLSGSMVERIVSQINAGKMKFLKIVLKADTKGSLEAIMQELSKIKTPEVAIKIIHYGVGHIADTDVVMAAASQGLLVGFHVTANPHIKKLAERQHIDIRLYTVIYKLIDDLKLFLSGMLGAEETVVELGKLQVKKIFLNKRSWMILGCEVKEGKVELQAKVRLMHEGRLLFESKIESLKHVNQDVRILEKGSECGIKINTPKPVVEGDILEAYKIERKERTLA